MFFFVTLFRNDNTNSAEFPQVLPGRGFINNVALFGLENSCNEQCKAGSLSDLVLFFTSLLDPSICKIISLFHMNLTSIQSTY